MVIFKFSQSKYKNDIRLLRMGGEIIDEVKELKYLGSNISNNLNKAHLKEKLIMTACSVNILTNNAGFKSMYLIPRVKTQLYKSYIRPVLTYGLETMVLGSTQLDKLHTLECNIIKSALNLSTRLESSELMTSLGIEGINERVDMMIPSFFYRLIKHDYTRLSILNMMNSCSKLHNKSHR